MADAATLASSSVSDGSMRRDSFIRYENTDHYLWRHERDAAAMVGDFADRMSS
jgi:hypothetical protein